MKNFEVKKYEKLYEIDSYFNEIKNFKSLTFEEESELAYKIKNGDEKALEKLVTSNLKFVVNIVKQYRHSGVPFSDLISEGNIGLIKAAKKFDPSKGVKLISYAVWWIKNSVQECINDYISNHSQNIGFDDYILDKDKKYDFPLDCGIDVEISTLQGRNESIKELMQCLRKREAQIVIEYFGLSNEKEKTLDEISSELNITNERVRQIKDKALIKLRTEALLSKEFETYKTLI